MPECAADGSSAAIGKVSVPPGWFLALLCRLDDVEPGFTARALRASKRRRRVIAACLAATNEATCSKPTATACARESIGLALLLERVGTPSRLLSVRHAKLLKIAFGDCPPGFAGAVVKTGPGIAKAEDYVRLHTIFTTPARRREAKALTHLPKLDGSIISIVQELPVAALSPKLLQQADSRDLKRLRDVLPILRRICPDAQTDSWEDSLRDLARHGRLSKFVTSWIKRAALPAPPVKGDVDVWPLHTVRMMLDAAKEYRNCLRDQAVDALKGDSYYYESRLLGTPAIIHVEHDRSAAVWSLGGIYGKGNAETPDPVQEAIKAWLQSRGIEQNPASARRWWALERLCEL